ncbi:hypothetical protein [Campylobacter sp. CCUG 57310]|uniref:hypothetical protein n=1 Tax=Campylobacter sp. CCUG 57310 TaxID=2517362 RepID=UPI0015636726|nr:hypothetical protein [Campylobacter sp. CCUG 57310]QKF92741.1 hypothetical protein CORI_1570 [Campylobacter sp. CCUG 57310]
MSKEVNLDGSEYIQNIPSRYFDAVSNFITIVRKDVQSGKYIAKIGLANAQVWMAVAGAGIAVGATINYTNIEYQSI